MTVAGLLGVADADLEPVDDRRRGERREHERRRVGDDLRDESAHAGEAGAVLVGLEHELGSLAGELPAW
jgi:hypothetical protein